MEIFRDTHKPDGCRRSLSRLYSCSVGYVGNLKSTQHRVKIKTQCYTETVAWNILYYDARELTYLASGIWTNTFLSFNLLESASVDMFHLMCTKVKAHQLRRVGQRVCRGKFG